jgi:hypothetical protein
MCRPAHKQRERVSLRLVGGETGLSVVDLLEPQR